MLLTDGSPNSTEDLRVYESAILGLANSEAIDLGVKLDLAAEEIAEDVLDFLLDHAGTNLQVFSPLQIGTPAARRRTIGVSDVVVTRQMKRWHAVHTLEIVYRDAFHNQLNDRYQPKFLEYRELTRHAREHTFHFGVGLALTPIPQAQTPVFSAVPGLVAETTYYARASWVGASGQEGEPSEMTAYSAPAGSLPVVQMTNPPAVATGFNVYLGLVPHALALQNPAPVPAGQSFTLAGTGLAAGAIPGEGQAADTYISGGWMLRRG
ncbi:MAG: hypothetical protein ACRD4E_03085 [Bryobacteraceae bacterium]